MRPITSLVPVPRTVRLGDRDFTVSEFRIVDMAEIQAWLDEQEPNPLDEIRGRLPGLPRREARALLREASDRADAWPPVFGAPGGSSHLDSGKGVCQILLVALRRHHPGTTPAEVLKTCLDLKPGQFGTLARILFGKDTRREIERLMGFEGPRGGQVDWLRSIDELSVERHWTYEYIYGLTLSEFANARLKGREPEYGEPVREGESVAEVRERNRRRWFDDDEE